MFKLVHYEARTVGKWAVDILLERSSVFFYVHSVFQNLPYVADKSGEKQNFLQVREKLVRILNGLKCVNLVFPFPYIHRFEFFHNTQSWQYCVFVCLKFENKLERQSITSILIQSTTTIESDSAFNCFQFISIRSRTKMPILPTSAL